MEDAISSCLLESVCRSIYGLSDGGEGASSQHLDLLCMTDFGSSVDHFLLGFEKLLSEVAELQYFPFDEGIS